jgi:hypothetical protein
MRMIVMLNSRKCEKNKLFYERDVNANRDYWWLRIKELDKNDP